jgi:hypothetical protein
MELCSLKIFSRVLWYRKCRADVSEKGKKLSGNFQELKILLLTPINGDVNGAGSDNCAEVCGFTS